eukprot:gb/GECG01013748.1/.p1 GENE.gb/GECG01013748.1/~~gb/GECG01013748.1/.p1  ORF type:complete len:411 (+),score=29.96 gb/GECG01013748.1/:1-1233(+)
MDNVIVVQVGQCGNQVGLALFQELFKESQKYGPVRQRIALNRFFRRSGAISPSKRGHSTRKAGVSSTMDRAKNDAAGGQETCSTKHVHASLLYPGPVAESAKQESSCGTTSGSQSVGALMGAASSSSSSVASKLTKAARAKQQPAKSRASRAPKHRSSNAVSTTSNTSTVPQPKAARSPPAPTREIPGKHAPTQSVFEMDDMGTNTMRLTARAVLVDMEPKVLRSCVAQAGYDQSGRAIKNKARRHPWRYDERRCIQRQSGSANNWAYGYSSHGPACREEVVRAVKREMALCDKCDGLLIVHSLGGGTGSGLGTYLTRTLKEEFPDIPLWNAVVWPYRSGEVVVQHFNCLLTLAILAEVSHFWCVARMSTKESFCVSCCRSQTVFSCSPMTAYLRFVPTCGVFRPPLSRN